MKRKFTNKQVEKVKEMLAKGYKNRSIKDTCSISYKFDISLYDISQIKTGRAYSDVKSDLNEKIFTLYESELSKEKKDLIEDIKFCLANGYDKDEIIKVFKINEKYLTSIRMLYAPYYNIAPEYNKQIKSTWRREKLVNIDSKIISQVKELYIHNHQKMTMTEIAAKFNIDKGTVSNIVCLKIYTNYGQKYHKELREIMKEKAKITNDRKRKKQEKKKKWIELQNLREQEKEIRKIIRSIRNELSSFPN